MSDWVPPTNVSVAISYLGRPKACGQFRLVKFDQLHAPLADFFEEMDSESARGRVVIVAAVIESLLEDMISAFLYAWQEDNSVARAAIPRSAADRVKLCVALGLISPAESKNILILQSIRNKFAHVAMKNFLGQDVVDLVSKLDFAEFGAAGDMIVADILVAHALNLILELYDRPRQIAEALRDRVKSEVKRTVALWKP